MEAKEIGRPSTYASIISTIMDRGYVYERGRALIPSWLAFSVTKLLETNFPSWSITRSPLRWKTASIALLTARRLAGIG